MTPAPLTPAERLARLRTDLLLIGALHADPCPIWVTAHRSPEDVRADRNPVQFENRNPAPHLRVVYDFDTLRGPGRRHRPTVVHVSPLIGGDYPASAPAAWVV